MIGEILGEMRMMSTLRVLYTMTQWFSTFRNAQIYSMNLIAGMKFCDPTLHQPCLLTLLLYSFETSVNYYFTKKIHTKHKKNI